jgi:hypothetical protein
MQEKIFTDAKNFIEKNKLNDLKNLFQSNERPDSYTSNKILTELAVQLKWNLIPEICPLITHKDTRNGIEAILDRACSKESFETIEYLCSLNSENKLSQDAIDKACRTLTFSKQWNRIKSICQRENKPSTQAIEFVMDKAYDFQNWDVIEYLYSLNSENKPRQEAINQAFQRLALGKQWNRIKPICQIDNKPSTQAIEFVMDQAYGAKEWDVIEYLYSLNSENKPRQEAINQAFQRLAIGKQWDRIKPICQMNNKPSTQAIEFVMDQAYGAKEWDVIEYLCSLNSENKPRQEAINQAFQRLAIGKQWNRIKPICQIDNKPSTQAIEFVMDQAYEAKEWDVIEYLCSLNSENKPRQDAIDKAFQRLAIGKQWRRIEPICQMDNKPSTQAIEFVMDQAYEANEWDVIEYLCSLNSENKPRQDAIDKAFQRLAIGEQWNRIKSICQIDNKPSTQAIEYVMNKVYFAQKWDIVEYLCSLDTKNKLSQRYIDTILIQLSKSKQWNTVNKIYQVNHIKPSQETNGTILLEAVTQNQLETIKVIYSLSPEHYYSKDISSAFLKAAQKGFVNILSFFSTHKDKAINILNPGIFTEAFFAGASSNQIEVLKYFFQLTTYQPKLEEIKQALYIAVSSDSLNCVKYFLEKDKFDPQDIKKAFLHAAEFQSIEVMIYFSQFQGEYELTQEEIKKALKIAASKNRLATIRFLLGSTNPHQLTPEDVVLNTLFEAVRYNNSSILNYLFSSPGYTPTPKNIKEAIEIAASNGHLEMVIFFLEKDNLVKPESKDVAEACLIAISNGFYKLVDYFINHHTYPLEQETINDGLLSAVTAPNGVAIIECFIKLNTTKKILSEEAIQNALNKATVEGKKDISTLLMALTSNPDKSFHSKKEASVEEVPSDQSEISSLSQTDTPAQGEPPVQSKISSEIPSQDKTTSQGEFPPQSTTSSESKTASQGIPSAKNSSQGKTPPPQDKTASQGEFPPQSTTSSESETASQGIPSAKSKPSSQGKTPPPQGKPASQDKTPPQKPSPRYDFPQEKIAQALETAVMENNLEVVKRICAIVGDNKPVLANINKVLKLKNAQDRDIKNCLLNAKKILKLHHHIERLRDHGHDLLKKEADKIWGNTAVQFADNLKQLTDKYAFAFFSDEEIKPIQTEFSNTLSAGFDLMSHHRAKWKIQLANVMLAATGVGLLINYIINGNAFFSNTKRQDYIQKISNDFEYLESKRKP